MEVRAKFDKIKPAANLPVLSIWLKRKTTPLARLRQPDHICGDYGGRVVYSIACGEIQEPERSQAGCKGGSVHAT